jgi:TrmH family RNA methyltransferase
LSTDQGALALVHVPKVQLPKECAQNTTILYACGVQDPGNLGTLIRTAAASGATFVCTSTGTVSARNPKTIRSSAGVFFHHPPVENISTENFVRFCREKSIRIFRTEILHGIPYTVADLASSCAILLGNEGRGVMEDSFAEFPALNIPMENGIESLNVALAGAVLLFEAARQRSLRNS